MDLKILPLAITMMAGPQIMSAIILVTTKQPVRVSLSFLLGVTLAVLAGVAITRGIFALLGGGVSLGRPADSGSVGTIIQYVLVGLLLLAAVRNYVKRAKIEPPKWLGMLMEASPRRAFTTGLLLLLLMPSDIAVMLTVGAHLEQHQVSYGGALPFIGMTDLIAALPLLTLLLFRKRAVAPYGVGYIVASWLRNVL